MSSTDPGSRSFMGLLLGGSLAGHLTRHAKPYPAVAVAGHEAEAVGGTAAAALIQPAAAPDHQEETTAEAGRHYPFRGAFRIFPGAVQVVVRVVPVAAPFPGVAVHVVQAPGVRWVGADLGCPSQVWSRGRSAVRV